MASYTRTAWSAITLKFRSLSRLQRLLVIMAAVFLISGMLEATCNRSARGNAINDDIHQRFGIRPQPPPPVYYDHDPDDMNPTGPLGASKTLVIAAYPGLDLGWLDELAQVSPRWVIWKHEGAPRDPLNDSQVGSLGREANAYLSYIVAHYDSLPDFAVFVHGHDRAWHQPMRLLDKLVALNFSALAEDHYLSLQCTEVEGCTPETKYYFDSKADGDARWGYHLHRFWAHALRPQLGPMPRVIGRRCCAQFAVTRHAVRRRPLVFYERLLAPLAERDLLGLRALWGPDDVALPLDRVGTLFEMTWHIIFGMPADYCPSRAVCEAEHFQGAISCDREVLGWKDQAGWEGIGCSNALLAQAEA